MEYIFSDINKREDKALRSKTKGINKKINCSDSQSFQLQYHQIKKLGLKINKSKINNGEWSNQENQIYLQFLIDNYQSFISYKSRRKQKVFHRLSKIMKKRTPDQCRSHHQKYQLKTQDDLDEIISQVRKKIIRSQNPIAYAANNLLANTQKDKLLAKTTFQQEVDSMIKILNDPEEWYALKSTNNNTIKIVIKQSIIASW